MSKSRRTSDLVNAIFVNPDNSVNIHEGTQSPYFLLDTGAVVTPQQGMMFWDSDRQTVGVQMNGVEARLGQDNFWYVKNQSGSDILKGTVVMAVGALGASSRILVAPMVADGSVEEQFLLGITAEDILNGEDGFVMNIGKIRGIDTTQYGTQAGQVLYCDPAVPGGLTITQPQAPNLDIPIAFTADYKSNGTLAVRTLPGYHLGELHDVQIDTPATDQILRYNNNRWENWTPTYLTTTPTLQQVTTAGNTTTNAISIGASQYKYSNNIVGEIRGNADTYNNFDLVYGASWDGSNWIDQLGGYQSHKLTLGTDGIRFFNGSNPAGGYPVVYTERMRINASGNVLIGTTTDAGYKLQVNGDALINTLTVGLGGGSVASNTAVGFEAGLSNTTGSLITAVGNQALRNNTTGAWNTAFGSGTLLSNSIGTGNTAIGVGSVGTNSSGNYNTAVGYASLALNGTGSNNVAYGVSSLRNNTVSNNVAVGYEAAYSNTSGIAITAVGYQALRENTGSYNTAVGEQALQNNSTGQFNASFGTWALKANTTGSYNSAFGQASLYVNTTGLRNSAYGNGSLFSNISGSNNTAIGRSALFSNNTSNNTAVGYEAGFSNTTGSFNVFLGYQAGYNNTTESNKLYIANNSTTPLIYGDFSTGNVMIGTTTDAGYKLDVNGTARITNDAYFATTSGNVGIGITAPVEKLHINGNVRIGLIGSQGYYLSWGQNAVGSSQDFARIYGIRTDGAGNQAGHLVFQTKPPLSGTIPTERLRITDTGNILIGTTTDASYKLDVNGTVRSVKNKIDITPTTNTTALDIRGTGTPNDFFTVSNATGGANDVFLPIFFYKAATYGYNGGTNRYPSGVYGGGFVGAVDDSSYPSAIGAGAAMHFNSRTYANNGPLNNRYLFSWGSWLSTYMTMTAGGNLLIGTTTNSGEKLQINGSAKVSGDVYAGGDFYQNGIQGYTGTFTIIQDAPNPPINVEVNGGIITNVT